MTDIYVDPWAPERDLLTDEDKARILSEESGAAPRRHLVLTPASAIAPQRVQWLWEGRVAIGTLALLAGREGQGKSTFTAWFIAQVTRGTLPGEHLGKPHAVLVCATEDSWAHTIVPRLIAADADLERVFRVEVRTAEDADGALTLPTDIAEVELAARQYDASLLILDPLTSRLDASLDSHVDQQVRQALEPIAAMSSRAHLAVIGLMHHNKVSSTTDPLDKIMASKAFTAVARSVHTVVSDPDDEAGERRFFGTVKNNLGRIGLPLLAFAIAGQAVPTFDGDAWTGRLEWGQEIAGDIAEVMSRRPDDDKTATSEAATWLTEWLFMQGGEDDSVSIKREGRAAGHSESALKRARTRLGITSRVIGTRGSDGVPRRRTVWVDPSQVSSPPTENTEPTEPTGPDLHQVGSSEFQSVQSDAAPHAREAEPTQQPMPGWALNGYDT